MYYCRVMMIAALALAGLLLAAACVRFPVLLFIPALALVWRGTGHRSALSAYGTARWASIADLKSAGMFGGGGLPLGYVQRGRQSFRSALEGLFDRRIPAAQACLAFMISMRRFQPASAPQPEMVRLNRAVHTAIFAPTGVGKGVSLVIPFLLTCRDSCVVVDFKGENAKLTADARRAMGHKVVILDPFKVVTQEPDTFNPLDNIDADSPTALDDCRALAEALVLRTGEEKEPHWNDSSEMWIAALLAVTAAHLKAPNRSLQSVRAVLADEKDRADAIRTMQLSKAWEGMLARLGNQISQFKDRELASVLTTTNRHLWFLDTVAIAANTRASTFNPSELRTGKVTVYLVLPPEHMRTQSALLRMWIGSMLRAVVRCGLGEGQKVHFVLDEAASLGQMNALDDAVDKFRGYGVRLQFYYQSLGQLKSCWKEGKDQTLLSNVSQVFFGVNEPQTAEYVSNRLGESTIVVGSGGTSGGGSNQETTGDSRSHSRGTSWNSNDNWQQAARKLLKPEEVTALSPRMAITFTPGVPPICTKLSRYFEAGLGNVQSRLRQIQTTAEVWLTAALMLLLSALGVWAAATR